MTDSTKAGDQRREGDGRAAEYAPQAAEERPLRGYAAVMTLYGAGVAAAGALVRHQDRPLPDVSLRDVVLVGVATHKLSRRLSKDSVTSPFRAPFTRYQGASGPAELAEDSRGDGVRKAVGELVTCPFCLSQWVATGFVFGLALAPRATRMAASVFASLALADFLQFGYAWAGQKAE
jgi:hypothetical protein